MIFDNKEAFEAAITANVTSDATKNEAGESLAAGLVDGSDVKYTGADVDFASADFSTPADLSVDSDAVASMQALPWEGLGPDNLISPVQGPGNLASGPLKLNFASPVVAVGFSTVGLDRAEIELLSALDYQIDRHQVVITEMGAGYIGVVSEVQFSRLLIKTACTAWGIKDVVGQLAA